MRVQGVTNITSRAKLLLRAQVDRISLNPLVIPGKAIGALQQIAPAKKTMDG
jgi:hypothetical protein